MKKWFFRIVTYQIVSTIRKLYIFLNPSYFQPVFIVPPNIVLPHHMRTDGINKLDYPIRCNMELSGSIDVFDFDVMLVTDEG